MKRAIKLSLFIGTVLSAMFLSILKFLQPVSQLHLTILSYMIILSSVFSGIYVFKRFSNEKQPRHHVKIPVTVETKDGKKITGLLSHISHGFVFLENCIYNFTHIEELTLPLNEIKNLEIE